MKDTVDVNTCDGRFCKKKEKCELYSNFIELAAAHKFPRSIDALDCVEPLYDNGRLIEKEFNRFVPTEKEREREERLKNVI